MKSSLKKLKGFALHKNDAKEKRDLQPSAQLDELALAAQGMQDMRNCYDSLLSAAAATANSAYGHLSSSDEETRLSKGGKRELVAASFISREADAGSDQEISTMPAEFSESLREMGACLLEKTALNDDEDSGRVLIMLGKVQFELQKLVDNYRSHIFQTITTPSESLLNELRTVEEMKRQCDEKRKVYEYMMEAQREKGRSKGAKGESFSPQQLRTAHDEYDEEATLFVFRLKSLRQGQSRSLLTQAARHHAAQLRFFRKGLQSLEAVEPHIKVLTEQQHIDYQFSGLEDDYGDDGEDDDGYDANDDGEVSFDDAQADHGQDISASRNSMEENLENGQGDLDSSSREHRGGSQSAPIYAEKKFDVAERIRQMRPSSTRKFHTYVLPTPVDAKTSVMARSSNARQTSLGGHTHNLWHSSPLEPKKHEKDPRDDALSGSSVVKAQSVLKESNINSASIKLPPPLAEGFFLPQCDPHTASDTKKVKRQAFSGPITGRTWSTKPGLSASGSISQTEHPQSVSGMVSRVPIASSSPKVSPSASPPLISPPRISELHELPRPPISSATMSTRPLGFVGHSAPLVARSQEHSTTSKTPTLTSNPASPLPMPPLTVSRSFSIPSSSQRAVALHVTRLLEAQNHEKAEEVASPPLTPISLTNVQLSSTASEVVNQAGKMKDRD